MRSKRRVEEGISFGAIAEKEIGTGDDNLNPGETNTYWRYCIMADKDPNGEVSFAIHEVYYKNDIPYAYTENPVAAGGDSTKEVKKDLRMMIKDVKDKPIIWTGVDFPKEYTSFYAP